MAKLVIGEKKLRDNGANKRQLFIVSQSLAKDQDGKFYNSGDKENEAALIRASSK